MYQLLPGHLPSYSNPELISLVSSFWSVWWWKVSTRKRDKYFWNIWVLSYENSEFLPKLKMMQIIFQEYKHFIGIILHITNGVNTALLPRQDRNQSREVFFFTSSRFSSSSFCACGKGAREERSLFAFPQEHTHGCINPTVLFFIQVTERNPQLL